MTVKERTQQNERRVTVVWRDTPLGTVWATSLRAGVLSLFENRLRDQGWVLDSVVGNVALVTDPDGNEHLLRGLEETQSAAVDPWEEAS